jgi:hypothetical protein
MGAARLVRVTCGTGVGGRTGCLDRQAPVLDCPRRSRHLPWNRGSAGSCRPQRAASLPGNRVDLRIGRIARIRSEPRIKEPRISEPRISEPRISEPWVGPPGVGVTRVGITRVGVSGVGVSGVCVLLARAPRIRAPMGRAPMVRA